MKHQRSWYLWLSKQDHLPRKLKQVVRVNYDIITEELWSEVTINADIPTEKFIWKPPEGWQEWRMPGPEEVLLKPGQEAPDFDLLLADGGRVKLSDYHGKSVSGCTFGALGDRPVARRCYISKNYTRNTAIKNW